MLASRSMITVSPMAGAPAPPAPPEVVPQLAELLHWPFVTTQYRVAALAWSSPPAPASSAAPHAETRTFRAPTVVSFSNIAEHMTISFVSGDERQADHFSH